MAFFAHSHLFLGPSTATVVSGPYIQVLDIEWVSIDLPISIKYSLRLSA
jgi:hypothetical protein